MSARRFKVLSSGGCHFQVPDRYEFESIIGGGAFGIVIKAKDKYTDKYVAIKRLKSPFNYLMNAIRAYREFEILQIVDHKNIIQLLNAYTPQENLSNFEEVYFVMEYMDYSLRVLINLRTSQFEGKDGGRKMSFLIYQLLCGVNHLHQAGIVHRDLTPDNVMIDTKFHLKIVDFGTARKIANSNTITKNVTTIHYSAPEVFYTNYDEKADLWSTGCIFAELLTGEVLFKGNNDYDQPIKIIDKVGYPDEAYVSALEQSAQDYLRFLPHRTSQPWEELLPDDVFPVDQKKTFCSGKESFPSFFQFLATNGRNLISRMLTFNPDHRISVNEALDHPYVSWRQHEEEIQNPPKGVYDGAIEKQTLSTEEWKRVIFERIKNYEKNHLIDII